MYLPPLIDSLSDLVNLCKITQEDAVGAWSVDSWTLKDVEVAALCRVFKASYAVDSVRPKVEEELKESGVDLTTLLIDDRWKGVTPNSTKERKAKSQFDRVTRADLIEWAAAALVMSKSGVPLRHMLLPNAVKGSRTFSKQGLDLLTFAIDPDHEDEDTLGKNERIIIGSVKHTIKEKDGTSDSYDLCYKLIQSLKGSELNRAYLTGQLRVLQAQMEEEGRDYSRIYLVLANQFAGKHLELMAFGAVDVDGTSDLREKLDAMLPKAKVAYCLQRHFSQLLVINLDQLHTAVV